MRIFEDKRLKYTALILITLFAAIIRLIWLDRLPCGIAEDEAYAAYNAYGLMTEGMDSWGYRYPVYCTAWSDGMNALYSYLVIPFFMLFGINIFAYRFLQALLGIICVPVAFLVGKEYEDERFGVFLAFVTAINPWQIVNNRWGLESNLAPGLTLIAVYFFIRALKNDGWQRLYLIFSAFFFGLTLYAYAFTWLIIPLFLLLCVSLWHKRLGINGYTIASAALLFFMALPLVLFILVNMIILQEISTAFISIPKMIGFRSEELSPLNYFHNFMDMVKLLIFQRDYFSQYISSKAGLFHKFTTPFYIFGIISCIYQWIKTRKDKTFRVEYIMLLWLFAALMVCGAKTQVSTIHFNMVMFPLLFFSAYGIHRFCKLVESRWAFAFCILFYCVSFVFFARDYIEDKATLAGTFYGDEADEVLDEAERISDIWGESGRIEIVSRLDINYSILMWRLLPLPSDFSKNAVYAYGRENKDWFYLDSFANYGYLDVESPGKIDEAECRNLKNTVFILKHSFDKRFEDMGYTVEHVNSTYSVAYLE